MRRGRRRDLWESSDHDRRHEHDDQGEDWCWSDKQTRSGTIPGFQEGSPVLPMHHLRPRHCVRGLDLLTNPPCPATGLLKYSRRAGILRGRVPLEYRSGDEPRTRSNGATPNRSNFGRRSPQLSPRQLRHEVVQRASGNSPLAKPFGHSWDREREPAGGNTAEQPRWMAGNQRRPALRLSPGPASSVALGRDLPHVVPLGVYALHRPDPPACWTRKAIHMFVSDSQTSSQTTRAS